MRFIKRYDTFRKRIAQTFSNQDIVAEKPKLRAKTIENLDEHGSLQINRNFIWTFWGIAALVGLVVFAVFELTQVIYLIVTGFIVALAIESLIVFWQRRGCSRGFSLFLSYFLLIIFLLSGVIIMVPFVVTQLVSVLQLFITWIQSIQVQIQADGLLEFIAASNLPDILKEWIVDRGTGSEMIVLLQTVISDNMSELVNVGSESLKTAGGFAVGIIDKILSVFVQIILVFTIAVFFSLERMQVFVFLANLTRNPKKYYETLEHLSKKLGSRLEGQLILCLIVGVLAYIGFWIMSLIGMDLSNKFSLALIAGLTEFLPYIGPILGSIPALLVATLAFGRQGFLFTAILFSAIQALENNVIVPVVMSHKLSISPLVIFLCMLTGGVLFGFLGVLLAVPLAVIATIFIQRIGSLSSQEKKTLDSPTTN